LVAADAVCAFFFGFFFDFALAFFVVFALGAASEALDVSLVARGAGATRVCVGVAAAGGAAGAAGAVPGA